MNAAIPMQDIDTMKRAVEEILRDSVSEIAAKQRIVNRLGGGAMHLGTVNVRYDRHGRDRHAVTKNASITFNAGEGPTIFTVTHPPTRFGSGI